MNSSCLLRCLSSVALVAFVAVLSTAQEGLDDYAVFSPSEGHEVSLERGYANVDIAGLEVLQEPAELKLFPGDFFVADGAIYAAFQRTSSSPTSQEATVWGYIMDRMARLDFSDPAAPSASLVAVDWGPAGPPARRQSWAAFAGADPEGTPFICLGGSGATGPFNDETLVICPLGLQPDGSFGVTRRFDSGWGNDEFCTRSISVDGSLATGDFTVAAAYWTHNTVLLTNNYSRSPARLTLFTFAGGEVDHMLFAEGAAHPELYNATVQNLGDNYLLVDDGAIIGSSVTEPKEDYAVPTIVRLTQGTSVKVERSSVLDAPAGGGGSNGATIFSVGGSWFLLGSHMDSTEAETSTCRIYHLPEGPRSLTGATLAWTIADSFPVNQSWGNPANYANLNTMRVVTVPRDANRTDIHISSASSRYSLYTVRHKDSTQTGQPLITGLDGATAPSRWHTLTGVTCPRPTTPGLYIEVRPDGTARKVLLTR